MTSRIYKRATEPELFSVMAQFVHSPIEENIKSESEIASSEFYQFLI